MSQRTVCFRVTGRVQGVGFRAYVQAKAREIGSSGWVANCSDGSVKGVITLSESLLPLFRETLLTGPPQARVEALEIEEAPASSPAWLSRAGETFRIERDCL